jgi:hypothetical protein
MIQLFFALSPIFISHFMVSGYELKINMLRMLIHRVRFQNLWVSYLHHEDLSLRLELNCEKSYMKC